MILVNSQRISEIENEIGKSKIDQQDYSGAIVNFNKSIETIEGVVRSQIEYGDKPLIEDIYHNRRTERTSRLDSSGAVFNFFKNFKVKVDALRLDAYLNRGIAKSYLQDYKGAITDYTQVLKIDPKLESAYVNRGREKYQLQDDRGAIADFTKAIEINKDNPETYIRRGSAKYALKDYKGAIIDYTKAIEIDPNYALAFNNRGLAKIALGLKNGGCLDLSQAGELGFENAYDNIKKLCQE